MIPTWLQDKTFVIYDLETELIPTEGIKGIREIYCIGITPIINGIIQPSKVFTSHYTSYSDGSLLEAISLINTFDFAIGHNNIGFDNPVVKNVLHTTIKPQQLDTLILSKIIFSKDDLFGIDAALGIDKDLHASYSLKAFGQRLGNYKIQFEDFSNGLTEQMTIYCKQDCDLTAELFLFLLEKENFPCKATVEIEHKAASIISEQVSNGFYIDVEKTKKLNTALLSEKVELANKLSTIFSPKFLKEGPVKTYKKLSKVRKYLPNPHFTPLLGTNS